jgi:hypothetical protein
VIPSADARSEPIREALTEPEGLLGRSTRRCDGGCCAATEMSGIVRSTTVENKTANFESVDVFLYFTVTP